MVNSLLVICIKLSWIPMLCLTIVIFGRLVPLKIRVFLWLLYREAILTNDNLIKRNWYENSMCCFCNNLETIQHLFFDCVLAKFLWGVIQLTFGLTKPHNIKHVYGGYWVQNMNAKTKRILFVGIDIIFWSIWLSQNDIVFNKKLILFYMKVLFRATYWIRTCASFQKKEGQMCLRTVCRLMETLTMEIFVKHGWWSSNRLVNFCCLLTFSHA
jgi:hypothetical protein